MGKSTFYKDFKAFISKGNVIDLAVAVVIGAAFNKIVSSLVDDIIMPLISLAAGGLNVTDWKWIIKKAALDAQGNVIQAETALRYGKFMQNVLDFLIIAFSIFIVLRSFTKLQDYKKKAIEKINSVEDEK